MMSCMESSSVPRSQEVLSIDLTVPILASCPPCLDPCRPPGATTRRLLVVDPNVLVVEQSVQISHPH